MRFHGIFLAILLGTSPALAQQCDLILTKGLREFEITQDSSSFLNTTFSQYCYESGETRAASTDVGLNTIVKSIPIKFTAGSSDAMTAMTNFCKTYSGSNEAQSARNVYRETIASKAYDTYTSCIQLVQQGFFVTHDILSLNRTQVLLRAGVGKPIQINGVDTTPNVDCYGPYNGELLQYEPNTKAESNNTLGMFCSREGETRTNGETLFREGTVAIDIKGSKYNFYWPAATVLPEEVASQVETSIRELRASLTQLSASLDAKVVVRPTTRVEQASPTKVGGRNPIDMEASCPDPQVMQGIKLHLGGTGQGILDPDGRPVSTFSVYCSDLRVGQ